MYRGRGRGRGGQRGPRFGGPRLPATLADEVEKAYGTSARRNGPGRRKEERKAARTGPPPQTREERPRLQRAPRPAVETEPRSTGKRRAEAAPAQVEPEEPPRKKSKSNKTKLEAMLEGQSGKKGKGKAAPQDEHDDDEADAPKKKELVLPQDDSNVEDREIAWLEYMLEKERKAGEESDGLDDLLDFADKLGPGRGLAKDDVSDSDLGSEGMPEFDLSEGEEDSEEESGDEEEWGGIQESEGEGSDEEQEGSDEEVDGEVASDDDELDGGQADNDESEAEEDESAEEVTATTAEPAAAAPSPGRYIPPALRAAQLAEKAAGDSAKVQERIKLERKAQGLLNKLSEANIDSILSEVEKLFGEYSRNDVTTTLTSQIMIMIGSKTNLLDSFVILYATLVGALHRVIGLEFGAHFVQTLVKKYNDLITATMDDTETDAAKEAFNLLTLIAELYNAGVIGAGLIYDLIRGFIGEKDTVMPERSVEGLMKIVKCAGSQLRSDDPASLKDIVTLVQEQTRGKDKDMTTRGRFMVETLANLRSGKVKGLGAERDDVARMRRFLSGLGKKRRLLAPEPLRVGLADLLAADSRGKWWLVGAGWSGNPLVERQTKTVSKKKSKTEQEDEEVLLELARKQGMNTDVRRSVFVVLLTSEDYVHACDRLNAFKLTDVQQREFVRIALHCCGMEQTYNPYYTLVLNNLCANSYDHRFTLQYALWDMLRELADGSVPDTRASNVAKALAFLIARASVDLTILKAVDFTDLSRQTRRFLDIFLRSLFLATQTTSPMVALPKTFKPENMDLEAVEELFTKSLANPELAGGLAYVLQPVKKNPGKDVGEVAEEVVRQGCAQALEVLAKAI